MAIATIIDTIRNILTKEIINFKNNAASSRTDSSSRISAMLSISLHLLLLPMNVGLGFIKIPLTIIDDTLNKAKQALIKTVTTSKNVLASTVILVAVTVSLLWISLLLHVTFYNAYVPTIVHDRDVNLQFSGEKCLDDSMQPCAYPSSTLSLLDSGQSQGYDKGLIQRTKPLVGFWTYLVGWFFFGWLDLSDKLLTNGIVYNVGLVLEIPDSYVNRDAGMFMVSVNLYTHAGEILRQSSRAVSTDLSMSWFWRLTRLPLLPLYIFNIIEHKQEVYVDVITHFVEDPFRPLATAYVEVQKHTVHIYRTDLRIEAQLTGLKYILYRFPLCSCVVGVTLIWMMLCIIAILSWWKVTSIKQGNNNNNSVSPQITPQSHETNGIAESETIESSKTK